jgi:uncharacterized repeat protein (TIGR01451 family)
MKRSLVFGLAIAGLLVGLMPVAVMAEAGLTLTTPYPAVTVDPGATAKFDITFTTPTPERVDVTITGTPDGWTSRMRGAGSTVSAVTTSATPVGTAAAPASPTAIASLEVTLPDAVAPNTYQVTVQGRSASGVTGSLTVDLTVLASDVGSVTATAQQPLLQGKAGTNFTFDVALKNTTNQEISFVLDVEGPSGWTVTATPSGQAQAATAVVAAGATGHVTVAATSPTDAEADQYPITLTATGGPQPVSVDLGVTITGSYSMTLNTQDSRLNASATVGQDTTLNLIVTNTGTAPLSAVTVTASPPQGWTITFAPDGLTNLAPNVPTTVVATIRPADSAVAGDYAITFRANSTGQGQTASDSVDIRTTVQTSPIWGFVGIGIIVLVVVGLFLVFRQYGRR